MFYDAFARNLRVIYKLKDTVVNIYGVRKPHYAEFFPM